VLEYIESLDIPYTINPRLTGDLSYGGETVFHVIASPKKKGERKIVAKGQRYNDVAKKFWGRKEVASIGASVTLKKSISECKGEDKTAGTKLFFIQLGFEAKLKSLQVLETLRKANIKVQQSLSKDKMSAQIAMAEKMSIPYIIIMGKKEAMEKSVVVRSMASRCQDTVLISELVEYVRKLK
jgi:histidyl-tRNA synthetase